MWYDMKPAALHMRKNGQSLRHIESLLGIPRSTLSQWCKNIELTDQQRATLRKNRLAALTTARKLAAGRHRELLAERERVAEASAQKVLAKITATNSVVDLAFAMLYFGKGSRSGPTSIASSNPRILQFVLAVLKRNYNTDTDAIRCELRLRADEDYATARDYWSRALGVPLECFKYIEGNRRPAGARPYNHYNGICVIYCGPVAIRRKLMYLCKLFCEIIITE